MALSGVGLEVATSPLSSKPATLETLQSIRDHVAKGALSMIDIANNKPANRGKKPKVGGHQASSMSSVDILCALYLHAKAPGDRVAVKPHAAPVLYALMHQMGVLAPELMSELREFGGLQPYPTLLKNPLFVDYTTSSEALGVCAAIYDAYAAVVQNRQLTTSVDAAAVPHHYWALCGDGELTEGQIDESLYDAGRWALDNLVWIVDLNRQSLDRVMDDSGRLEAWVEAKFKGHGWHVERLRWGHLALALFALPGGAALQKVLDRMPDTLFHPLQILDAPTVRQALLGQSGEGTRADLLARFAAMPVSAEERASIAMVLDQVDDETLLSGLHHLGGHDLGALIDVLDGAKAHRGAPVVVIAHTVKGYETSAAGHPENHGALLPTEEVQTWGLDRGLEPGPFPTPRGAARSWLTERGGALFDPQDHGWLSGPVDVRGALDAVRVSRRDRSSSGEAFQSFNLALMRGELAPWLQFGAPDVGQTTHLGPVIRQTGVFAPRDLPDSWDWLREERQLAFQWRPSPMGQFHSLGIAEGNAFLWAYAFGRQCKPVEDRVPLLSVVTVYDKFFERGFNQLDYAVYSGARFIAVGVPSGTGLSRETATHQSLQTLRMMMDVPGILAYEPAFGEDLVAIYRHALGQLWSEDGEAVYLRLSTQPLDQPAVLPEDHAVRAIRGAYWLVGEDERDGNGTVVFVASGRKLAQAREAAASLLEHHGVGSRVLNVTSYEALWRDWDQYSNDPSNWADPERTYWLHELFTDELINAPLIVTGDHLSSVSDWLPGALQRVRGHRFLGPRRNGEAGDLESIDRLHGMAVDDLVGAALDELRWRKETGG